MGGFHALFVLKTATLLDVVAVVVAVFALKQHAGPVVLERDEAGFELVDPKAQRGVSVLLLLGISKLGLDFVALDHGLDLFDAHEIQLVGGLELVHGLVQAIQILAVIAFCALIEFSTRAATQARVAA